MDRIVPILADMRSKLERYFEARRALLKAEAELLGGGDDGALVAELSRAKHESEDHMASDKAPRAPGDVGFRLQGIADIAGKLEHTGAAHLLISLLGDEDFSVRLRAAEALRKFSRRRFSDLVRATCDAAATAPASALVELPALLLECADPAGPAPTGALMALLMHDDADVAAEAACALSDTDDPDVERVLRAFVHDPRPLEVVGDGPQTLGALVESLLETAELAGVLSRRPPMAEA